MSGLRAPHTDRMNTTAPTAEPAARPTLAQLAEQEPEELLAGLRNALPDNTDHHPRVSAFQSSI